MLIFYLKEGVLVTLKDGQCLSCVKSDGRLEIAVYAAPYGRRVGTISKKVPQDPEKVFGFMETEAKKFGLIVLVMWPGVFGLVKL